MHCQKMRKDIKAMRKLSFELDKRRRLLNRLRLDNFHLYKWVIREYNIPDVPPS